MAKKAWKGGAMLAPVPAVMVSVADGETSDIVTVAWTGIVCTNPPMTYISLRPERYSYGIVKKTGEFVINLTTASLAQKADLCGMLTGRKVDKFARAGLTKEKASTVDAPAIAESPLTIECKVRQCIALGTHDMFLADITAVNVDESLIDDKGKLRLDKAGLMAYAHGEYFELGKKLGSFGYSVKKRGKQHKGRKKADISK